MDFTFKHPVSGEIKTVTLSDRFIHHHMEDYARDDLGCSCEPIGETNVVECGCGDYYDEFQLQPQLSMTNPSAISERPPESQCNDCVKAGKSCPIWFPCKITFDCIEHFNGKEEI